MENKKQLSDLKPITKTRKAWLLVCLVVLLLLFIYGLTEIISGIYFFVISGGRVNVAGFLNLNNLIFTIIFGYGLFRVQGMLRLSKKTRRMVWGISIILATLFVVFLLRITK